MYTSGGHNCTVLNQPSPEVCGVDQTLYHYYPNKGLGIFFTIVFGIEALILLVIPFAVMARSRRSGEGRVRGWYMHCATVCALGEMIGWIGRVLNASPTGIWDHGPYIMQAVLLVIVPVFISAANYVTFERIVRYVGEKEVPIQLKWIIPVFVGGDIISLLVQGSGGGLAASTNMSTQNTGSDVLIAGVSIQVVVTVPFMCLLGIYLFRHYQLRRVNNGSLALPLAHASDTYLTKSTTASSPGMLGGPATASLQGSDKEMLYTLQAGTGDRWTPGLVKLALGTMVSTIFILVRCIYRVVEMAMGWNGFLNRHQYYFLFDAIPILLAVAVFCGYHPAICLPRA